MAILDHFKRRVEAWVAGEDEDGFEAPKPQVQLTRKGEQPMVPRAVPGSDSLPSYSDGFEQIYAYENIDPRSVRPMGSARAEEPEAKEVKVPARGAAPMPSRLAEEQRDRELDLGEGFRGWLESFRLSEPIDVLGLSQMAHKALVDQDKRLIRDLLDFERHAPLPLQGMGQGHIDEIEQKLRGYLGDRPLFECGYVDYLGLLRGLLNGVHPKKVYLVLREYGLESLYPLSAAEEVEVRHLGEDSRREAIEAAVAEIATETRRTRLKKNLKQVSEVFLKPWMRTRHGIATESEIGERAELVSDDAALAEKVLRALSDLFLDGAFPFAEFLIQVDARVYCSDYSVKKRYLAIQNRINSYFYRRGLHYPYRDLLSWLLREQAKNWETDDPGFVEKILKLSPVYRVRKASDGHLTVRRA